MTAKYPDTDRSERIALFAGSFNPFTIGHASVVERALQIFDSVVIAIGVNRDKPSFDYDVVHARVSELYEDDPRVQVIVFHDLAVDAAERVGACALLRGVRSVADFEYERNMADINRRLSGIETVLLFSLPEHAAVSSSVVRELRSFGRDVSSLLP